MSVDYDAIIQQGKDTCTLPDELTASEPYSGTWTYHKTITVISAIFAILTILICVANIIRHLKNFSCAYEQRQVVRIIITPVVFSVCSFFGVWFYDLTYYLKPVAELYEAIPLIGLFLLFIAFSIGAQAASASTEVHAYFDSLARHKTIGKTKKKHHHGSLRWFYVHYIMVFQILPARIAIALAEWITHANACPLDEIPTWIQIINIISLISWIIGTLSFYRRLKESLKPRNAFLKFLSFKIIVFVQAVQDPIISLLIKNDEILPTDQISYYDWKYGLPSFLVVIEMFLFSILFLFSFNAKEYIYTKVDSGLVVTIPVEMTFTRALVHTLDIRDILKGCIFHQQFIAVCSPEKAGLRRGAGPGQEQEDHEMLRPPPASLGREVSLGTSEDSYVHKP